MPRTVALASDIAVTSGRNAALSSIRASDDTAAIRAFSSRLCTTTAVSSPTRSSATAGGVALAATTKPRTSPTIRCAAR